jgi:hypothetical protein
MDEDSNFDVDERSNRELFPPEFLGAIQETASSTLENYLRANHAPDAVIGSLRDLVFLQYLMTCNPEKWNPDGRRGWNMEMQGLISRMAWEVIALGGEFQGPDSTSRRREPVKWQFPKRGELWIIRPIYAN